MHVGEGLQDLPPLIFCPHHEGIHGPLDVGLTVVPSPRLPEHSCLCDIIPYVTQRNDILIATFITSLLYFHA